MTKSSPIENYISYQKSTDKSPSTLASYRSDLIQFSIWFQSVNGAKMTLFNITPTDARQYKQHLIASGLRPQTINRRLLSLKYFLKWSWDTKKVKYPFPLPKTVKQTQATPKWLSRTEQNQVFRHIERYGKPQGYLTIKF